jgi:triosephosphate isomerase
LRKPIIAGNWKMNNTLDQAERLVEGILGINLDPEVDTVLCVPYLSIQKVKAMTDGTGIKVGAQNLHWEDSGAYTGEISPLMLKELGADYVIIGHSERRQYFCETDETVNKKLMAAHKHGIVPIVCVGETLSQREEGIHKELVKKQVLLAFEGISSELAMKSVVAYEPIWAIGTGKTATAEQADEMCSLVRGSLEELYGKDVSDVVRIQYGGSVKPDNISELMSMENIDGALVGGASLKAEDFTKLINY